MVRMSVIPKDVNHILFHSKLDLTAKERTCIWEDYSAQELTNRALSTNWSSEFLPWQTNK
jgi:hypothetical protein